MYVCMYYVNMILEQQMYVCYAAFYQQNLQLPGQVAPSRCASLGLVDTRGIRCYFGIV